jgi:GNAT superfamily N-acetyltransferase
MTVGADPTPILPAGSSVANGPRGNLPAVKLVWHHGEDKPDLLKSGGIPKWDSGCLFIGGKGMILADYDREHRPQAAQKDRCIAVSKQVQARGVGRELLDYLEQDIRSRHGRLLVLETSGLPSYELTRRFYLKNGYEQAAVVKDYSADGHDMVVFRKRLGD